VDAAEEWCWGAPEGGYTKEEYLEKLANLQKEVEALNPA
jgi:hypothetical protein